MVMKWRHFKQSVILSDGKLSIGEASASFEGADLLAIETLPITDARLKTAWDHDLYRIRLKGNDASFRLTIQ
jgi:exoribonuclease R